MPQEVGPNGSPVPFVGTLTCGSAVAAAEALVGPDPAVTSIEFAYGFYCPPGYFCVLSAPNEGHVVFHRQTPRPDLVVDVRSDDTGKVTAFDPRMIPTPAPS